jgi:site-specific DNA-methyltransferase (adenine-specific)
MTTINLINDDCLEAMKDLKEDSVDLLFCDLPYGILKCAWDCPINLDEFWKQVNRVCKDTTPMIFTCTTKFGNTLINSNPKNFQL